jgi:DNA-binding Xre family transcriptional regulator
MAVRNFKELREKMAPERQANNKAEFERMLKDMPLDELRVARELTQQQLAQVLEINQAAVSKIERSTNMYITTLSKFIEAMGGQLEIRAVFRDGIVRISQFGASTHTAGQ